MQAQENTIEVRLLAKRNKLLIPHISEAMFWLESFDLERKMNLCDLMSQ